MLGQNIKYQRFFIFEFQQKIHSIHFLNITGIN